MSNKIKNLLEKLKSELKKETGIEPNIEINFHRTNQSDKRMSLLEAHTKYNNINQKLNNNNNYNTRFYSKDKGDHDSYISLSNNCESDVTEIFMSFQDRRDEIENRQSDTRKRVQEPELPEMAVY